jgi:hypothetical protein
MIYKAVNGQSLADICMNTYGSMDFFYKLLQDSGVANANQIPYSGQPFTWDETLTVDNAVNRTTILGKIRYATAYSNNNNTFYIVGENGVTPPPPGNPTPPPIIPISMYQKTSATSYEATTDGETVISLPSLAGKNITQIEKNIQPLTELEWSWNKVTATLTLTGAIGVGEKLFIIYNEMVSA